MRVRDFFLASLAVLLAFSSPALAQSADPETAADSQYRVTTQSATADIPKTLAGNAADGTGAVNDALSGSSPSGEPDAAPDKVAGLTVLPETGGASLPGLGAGVFVSGAGVLLLIRRTNP